jgi:membrane protein YdbS with pleckstrin-like domain
MSSADKYPENIEFEIDRPRLLKYWRLQALGGYCACAIFPAVMIAGPLIGEHFRHTSPPDVKEALVTVLIFLAACSAAASLLGAALYFALGHYQAKWSADNLRLLVEGPYLRIVSGAVFVTDRRIHFRAISDYSTHDGPLLRRLKMKTISFRIIGQGQPVRSTSIPGVIDPIKVRDMLCEIDAAREN